MSTLWSYFWPIFAAALVCGAFAMWLAYRQLRAQRSRRHRRITLIAGASVAIMSLLLWHYPLGGAARMIGAMEGTARTTLVYYELPHIRAVVQREPLTRRILLSGAADRFQRRELVRIMNEVPGVGSAAWKNPSGRSATRLMLPLLLEAALTCLAGFGLGVAMAHLVELRRRANAEWSW